MSIRSPLSAWSDSLAQLTGIAAGTIMARPGEKRMTKITTLCLLVGIVLFFTGHQRTVAIILMIFGFFGLIGATVWSKKR
jgi:nicotinamide riboside transporter PnuC